MRAIMTMADLWRPCVKTRSLFYDLCAVVGGSALIALSAQLVVHLPFSPVPITGQTFAVLLLAALLGSARGVLCVLTYLAEGLSGLPVFAGAGSGPAWLLGATGGYLVGFVPAAWLVGRLAQMGWDRRFRTTVAAMLFGNTAIYACGLAWLACLNTVGRVNLGLNSLLTVGLYPYILGDILKAVLAGMLLPGLWQALGRSGRSPEQG